MKRTAKNRRRQDEEEEDSSSSSEEEEEEESSSFNSSDNESSSESSSDSSYDERGTQARRGKGSLSQMKALADKEKARIAKGSSSKGQGQSQQPQPPPKKRGRKPGSADKGDASQEVVTPDEHKRLVSQAIQLLLFTNTRKRPIRKDDVNEHVLKDYKGKKSLRRLSKSVFDDAVSKMRDIFGYDVQPLKKPSVKGDPSTSQAAASYYVLINTLTKPTPPPGAAVLDDVEDDDNDDGNNNNNNNNDDDDDNNNMKEPGDNETAVPMSMSDDRDAALHGLLMVVLGIIVLSDGAIQESQLFERLCKAGVGNGKSGGEGDDNNDDPVFGSVKDVINSFVAQQYITRTKTKDAEKPEETVKVLAVGPRTFVEFDLRKIVMFTMRMFGYKKFNEKHIDSILSTQTSKKVSK